MKIYLVGGAVRDKLLGLPIKERDWVVVGATADDMQALGYRQVGKEFPVFLHPKTNEEYALARMERKVNAGYKGFTFDTSPEVSLKDDLLRRDLTINAMAETAEGEIIDPYHGQDDLKRKLLRHVSLAFMEDPVRILRIGRFLARYAHLGFQVAPETNALMQAMVKAGEVDALVAERVWKEFERALREKNPEKFFEVLDQCGALTILFPQINLRGQGLMALTAATVLTTVSVTRFAALLFDLTDPKKNIADLCNRYRAPNEYRELAILTAQHYATALQWSDLSSANMLTFFNALDIFRREPRFQHFLTACAAIAVAKQQDFAQDKLLEIAKAAKSFPVQALIAQGLTGPDLAEKIKHGRLEKIEAWRQSNGTTKQ